MGRGSGGGGRGGGGGGGGGDAQPGSGGGGESSTSQPESVFNAIGKEISFGGEEQNVGNSRLFGANKLARDISEWKNLDANAQAGFIDTAIGQLKGRSGDSPLTKRASRDIAKLWGNTKSEAKDILAKQNIGDTKARNSTIQSIARQSSRRLEAMQRKEDADRKARRRANASKSQASGGLDDLFFGL